MIVCCLLLLLEAKGFILFLRTFFTTWVDCLADEASQAVYRAVGVAINGSVRDWPGGYLRLGGMSLLGHVALLEGLQPDDIHIHIYDIPEQDTIGRNHGHHFSLNYCLTGHCLTLSKHYWTESYGFHC